MKTNKLENLIVKLNRIKDKYKVPLPKKALSELAVLCPNRKLPEDFFYLNSICRTDFFNFFDFFNFERNDGVARTSVKN